MWGNAVAVEGVGHRRFGQFRSRGHGWALVCRGGGLRPLNRFPKEYDAAIIVRRTPDSA